MESKRLAQIIGHIDVGGTSPITSCPTAATTSTFSSSYHSNAAFPFISPSLTHLQSLLDGSQSKIRSIMRNIIDTESLLDEAKSLESHYYEERAMNLEKLKRVAELSAPHIHLRDLQRDPAKMFAWFETLAMYEHNLVLKFVVQYNLWGGTILLLGTQHHHNRYVDGISAGHIPGIFGLTELGHGSNVQRLETTATYDNKTKEFVIHSPQRTSAKYWPGGIVRDGVAATIFARLILDGKEHGIHAFVVPIRESPAAKPYPGIEVWDIGHKGTYNGMDNGGLLFSHVRIPRENMLNRFSDVTDDGKYVNKMKDARAHFGATMGVFLGGRICAGLICLSAAKCGLYIALHYAHHRHQFGPDGEREIPIIAHRTHQTRLMPHLARAYTLDMILKHSISLFVNQDQSNAAQIKMLHALSSGLKAISTWDSFNALQECRECMGGQGIVTKNRVIILRDQVDMFLTGEGDNTVMLQQVSKYLLALYHSEKKNSSSASSTGPGPIGANTPTDTTSVTSNLLSPTYQAQLLTLLESSMLHQLSTSLTHAQRTTSTSSATQREFMIWNDHLPQSNRVAMVHIRRMIQQHVRTVVDATVDQATRDVLNVIAHLDALVSIHEYSSYLLAHGLMRPSEGIVLPDIIVDLCRRLTPHALTLVEAFGIPKKCRTMDQSNQID